ncbi:hypothetical protein KY285_010992 [Solanum tuberosum]|nr:hypothetical protein KY285_010992 [Solanum tuberosum]
MLHIAPTDTELQQLERQKYQKFRKSSFMAEMFLQQRSKATWIKLGDDNTKYFFSIIKMRRLQQAITQITDEQGVQHTDSNAIAQTFVDYYKHMLGSKEGGRIKAVPRFLQHGHILTTAQQMGLIRTYTRAEVKQAMFGIDINKSPGPDGYGSGFFKEAWCLIGEDITQAVLQFLENGKLLTQINATVISLIPKVKAPVLASQFRPISCCNVIYKCISKVLCLRLKAILPSLVDGTQAAFVEGRSLVHNVLICHDLLRHYNRKTSPRLVMTCVTTTHFSVRVNGESYGYFEGKRGLRQGDPISPLLFVIVMEYLSRILRKMSDLPDFKFHPLCKVTKLTHLIFADDLMIFCRGDMSSVTRVMEALDHFSQVTGLIANLDKSNIFIAGVGDEVKQNILTKTGFSLGTPPIKYLGLPLTSKKWTKMECQQLVDKIIARIQSAYAKLLSYAGRLQIVMAVLFSIYNFWGAVFILPQSVLKEIDRKCREFLWNAAEGKRKVALVAWDKVCVPKKFGGLNIKECCKWNVASVGKLCGK